MEISRSVSETLLIHDGQLNAILNIIVIKLTSDQVILRFIAAQNSIKLTYSIDCAFQRRGPASPTDEDHSFQ